MDAKCNLSIVLDIPITKIFEIKGQQTLSIGQGAMQVMESEQHHLVMIRMGQFQYALQKNIPVLTKQLENNNKMYILPGFAGAFYGIIIPYQKDISEVWDYILGHNAQLVEPKEDQQDMFCRSMYSSRGMQVAAKPVTQQELMAKSGVQLVQVNLWEHVGEGQKSAGVGDYLLKGGQFIRAGLIATAGFVADGIKKGGSYVASQVTSGETKEIDQDTMRKVQLANTGTKAVVTFTKAQVEAIINMAKVIGEEAGNQFAASETGKKMQDHRYYGDAKEVGTAALYAFVTVYDGLYEALGQLANSAAGATTEVIQKKYGDQAGKLSKEGFEVAGNVGEFARIYEDAAAKAVLKQQQQQQQQQKQ